MLIDLEGIDGCGKSTQTKLLQEKLEELGEKTIILKEPTNEPHGQKLWDVLHGKRKATNEEILDFFLLDRKQHVDENTIQKNNQQNIKLYIESHTQIMAWRLGQPA